MRLKYKFVIEKIGKKYIAVTTDEDAGKYRGALKVNELGKQLLTELQNEITLDGLYDKFRGQFEDNAEMSDEIDSFLKQLEQEGLLINL